MTDERVKCSNINVICREDLVQGHNLCKYGYLLTGHTVVTEMFKLWIRNSSLSIDSDIHIR